MRQTWFLTGGSGFIGGNFVPAAIAAGATVINLGAFTCADNLDTLSSLTDDHSHVFVKGDIGDSALVSRPLAAHQPDALINFAGESHVDRSIDGPADFIQTNAVGTWALLECARDYRRELAESRKKKFRFLQVSTDEIYGEQALDEVLDARALHA